MKYVQATKPEKHNGGVFFEHEIHFDVTGNEARYGTKLVERIVEFIDEKIGTKHTDYRISKRLAWVRPEGANLMTSPSPLLSVKVRFADKNKALLFKLSWII